MTEAPRQRWRGVLSWVRFALIVVSATLLVNVFVVQSYSIPSGSMIPTLKVGDRIVVEKVTHHWGVHRGDVVVFTPPPNALLPKKVHHLVKRVVGVPGDRLSIRDQRLYVNGDPLPEAYLPEGTVTLGVNDQEVLPGHLFVMGDNRSNSEDSRVFGQIDADLVEGNAVVRYWPDVQQIK